MLIALRKRRVPHGSLIHPVTLYRATVLLTTHYLDETQKPCDWMAFIREGRILARRTRAQVVDRYDGEDLEGACSGMP